MTNCSKVGREAFTLLDKPFFYLLGKVSGALEAAGVGYALYGGCGLQAHFANKLAGQGSIADKPELAGYFRPTSDYDFAVSTQATDSAIKAALEVLQDEEKVFEDDREGESYKTIFERFGVRRPRIRVKRNTTTPYTEEQNSLITMTFESDDLHDRMIKEGQRTRLVYPPLQINVNLAPLEYTLAGKMIRLGVDRDVGDMLNIIEVFGGDIDVDKVRQMLVAEKAGDGTTMRILRGGSGRLQKYLKDIEDVEV